MPLTTVYRRELTDVIECVAISWHLNDVLDLRPDLSGKQASQVLLRAKALHDPHVGINWDMLAKIASELYPVPGAPL
jgi:hypothetical protein